MFTPPLSAAFLILSGAVIGLVVAIPTGLFASLLLRLTIRLQDIVTDGVLGAIAFPLAFAAAVHFAATHFQGPDLAAYAAAISLPILRVLYRLKNGLRP